jgi:dTDP-4-amino-4,6-dideoxygalactose transaminase
VTMINYVQDKSIDYESVKLLLDKSAKLARFTNDGPVKAELENTLAKILGVGDDKRVVCTSNGTTALHALMFMYGRTQGCGKLNWVTIDYNFPSAVIGGFDTEVIDIELTDTGYAVPCEALSVYDGFILPTLFGTLPDNLDEIISFCKEEGILLILDNASSPINESMSLCSIGDASFGSQHHTKYLGFGEGGFMVMNKDKHSLAESITNFGFHQSREHHRLSSNFKMSDVSAAFILSHINNYDVDAHIEIQKTIVAKLSEIGVSPFAYSEGVVYGNLPIKFKNTTSHLVFRDYGIEANKYYVPLKGLPNSKKLYDCMVNFPLHAKLLDYEIDKIVEQIAYAKNND